MAHSQKSIASLKIKLCLFAALVSAIAALPLQAQPDLPESATVRQRASVIYRTLHLSPDGRYALQLLQSFQSIEGKIQYEPHSQISLWETATGRLKWRKTTRANSGMAGSFSPDSTHFLVLGDAVPQERKQGVVSPRIAEIIPIEDNAEPIPLEVAEGAMLRSPHFLPDGQSLIGLSSEIDEQQLSVSQVRLWDAKTGKLKGTLEDKSRLVKNRIWTVSNRLLAAASNRAQGDGKDDNELTVWSLPELTLRGVQPLGNEVVGSIASSPNGKKLVYKAFLASGAGSSNEVSLWDLETGHLSFLDAPPAAAYVVHSLEFSPDSQTLIGLGSVRGEAQLHYNEIWMWNAHTGALVKSLNRNLIRDFDVHFFKLMPDGKSFVGQTSKGQIELRSLEDGALIRTFE